MTSYGIVKCRSTRLYRIVELVQTSAGEFGMTIKPNGLAGWFTFTTKAEALKAARKLAKRDATFPKFVSVQMYEETPFAPMTSKLRLA
jgi:hypothetical protein